MNSLYNTASSQEAKGNPVIIKQDDVDAIPIPDVAPIQDDVDVIPIPDVAPNYSQVELHGRTLRYHKDNVVKSVPLGEMKSCSKEIWQDLFHLMRSQCHLTGDSLKIDSHWFDRTHSVKTYSDFNAFSNILRCVVATVPKRLGVLVPKQFQDVDAEGFILRWLFSKEDSLIFNYIGWETLVCCSHECPSGDVDLRDALKDLVGTSYEVAFEPQFFGDMIKQVTSTMNAVIGALSGRVMQPIVDFFNVIKTKVSEFSTRLFADGFTVAFNSVMASASEKLSSAGAYAVTLVKDPLFILGFSTAIRFWAGYTSHQLLLELVFAIPHLVQTQAVQKVWAHICSTSLIGVEAQDGDDDTSVTELIYNLFLGATTAIGGIAICNRAHVVKLCSDFSVVVTALNKAGADKAFQKLSDYVMGRDRGEEQLLRVTDLYPQTVGFYKCYMLYLELLATNSVTPIHKRSLGASYAWYLKEKPSWVREDKSYLESLVFEACAYVRNEGLCNTAQVRLQPDFFLFSGSPGMLKSTCVQEILGKIAGKGKSVADIAYTVNPVDKFSSGYANQSVWVLDEFLQKVDSQSAPCTDLELLFRLANNGPLCLNMAAVNDKGMFGTCDLILGCTNIQFAEHRSATQTLKPYIKSVSSPSGLRRRLTHIVIPKTKNGYKLQGTTIVDRSGNRLCGHVNVGDILHFMVIGSTEDIILDPSGSKYHSWEDLQIMMAKSFALRQNYKGEDKDLGFNPFHPEESNPKPEVTLAFKNEVKIFKEEEPIVDEEILESYVPSSPSTSAEEVLEIEGKGKQELRFPMERIEEQGFSFWSSAPPEDEEEEPVVKCVCGVVKSHEMTVDCMVQKRRILEVGERFVDADGNNRLCWFISHEEIKGGIMGRVDKNQYGKSEEGPEYWGATGKLYVKGDDSLTNTDLILGVLGFASLVVAGVALYKYATHEHDMVQCGDELQFYNKESQVYEDQAPDTVGEIVKFNGQTWIRTGTAGAYKFYAQGGELEQLRALKSTSKSVEQQGVSIESSIFAIVNEDKFYGNAFALHAHGLLMPAHIWRSLLRLQQFTLVREGHNSVKVPVYTEEGVAHHSIDVGDDLVVVTFRQRVNPTFFSCCRDHANKICNTIPRSGKTMLKRRDRYGKLHSVTSSFTYTVNDLTYGEGVTKSSLKCKSIRMVQMNTQKGWCGGIYLDADAVSTQTILGVHVAGTFDDSKYGVMHTCSEAVREACSLPIDTNDVSNVVLQGNSPTVGFLQDAGFGSAAQTNLPVPYYPKSSIRKTKFFDVVEGQLDITHVKPFLKEGVWCDPMQLALNKLALKVRTQHGHSHFLYSFARELATCFPKIPTKWRAWDDVTRGSEEGLPCVKRGNAAGSPFFCPKKFLFEKGEDVVLTPEAKVVMDDFINCVMDGTNFMSLTQIALKDEVRTRTKVMSGSARLYNVVPVHEFLAERLAFYDVCLAFTQKNLVYCSALGVSPDQFCHLHSHMAELGPDSFVIAGDFAYMDGSVDLYLLTCVNGFLIGVLQFEETAVKETFYGLLGKHGWLCVCLMERLGQFIMQYGDALFRAIVSHPSGSFITTVINNVVQLITWVYCIKAQFSLSLAEILLKLRMIFMGDDSLIACDPSLRGLDMHQVVETFRDLGFTITNDEKTGPPDKMPLWNGKGKSEYSFLSRRFAETEDGIVGVLHPIKVKKIIAFSVKDRFMNNGPDQFLSLFDELEYHRRCDNPESNDLIAQMNDRLDREEPGLADTLWKLYEEDKMSFKFEVLRVIGAVEAQAGGSDESEKLGGNSVADTTTFVQDISEDVEEVGTHASDWRSGGMEKENHGEEEVFKRPHVVSQFQWTGATPEVAWLDYMPTGYFRNNFNAQAKLTNYAYINATMCIRVLSSTSPYAAGKGLLHVRPLGALASTNTMASGDPCVELDVSSGKSVELKVPFCAPTSYLLVEKFRSGTFGNPDFDAFTFAFRIIAPIQEVGSSNVQVKIFAWLEDIKLHGPTFTAWSLSPQGGIGPTEDGVNKFRPGVIVKNIANTVIDTGLDLGPKLAKGAMMAALAGLSKPAIPDNTNFVMVNNNIGGPHMLGLAPSQNLGVRQNQQITTPAGSFATERDEMCMVNYISRPGIFKVISWDATVLPETTIDSFRVNPGLYHRADVPLPARSHTPLSAVARFFRFWRGGITYRFAIAKTRFHSGLLEILYQPGVNDYTITADRQATICYRVVWDIQESSSIEVTVPYMASIPWSAVFLEDQDKGVDPNVGCPTGYIHLRVLNSLVSAQDLVTDVVSIVCYVKGEPDMEFALPSLPYTEPVVEQLGKGKEEVFEAQGGNDGMSSSSSSKNTGGVFQRDETAGVSTLGSSLMMFNTNAPNELSMLACVGERIVNLRMLLRRFSSAENIDLSSTLVLRYRDIILKQPFAKFLLEMFAFHTGGARFQLTFSTTDNTILHTPCWAAYGGYRLIGVSEFTLRTGETRVATLPFYNIVPFLRNAPLVSGTSFNPLLVVVTGQANADGVISYSTGDDFSLGWQIGPPLESIALYPDQLGTYFPPYTQFQ